MVSNRCPARAIARTIVRQVSTSPFDEQDPSLADVQQHFARFAATYPELPLYHRISDAASRDDEVAQLLLVARPGQARPVLLLAALHDFVLAHRGTPAARWFASVGTPPESGDPWPDVRTTLLDNAAAIKDVIATHATQTNEVNRAAYLAPLLAEGAADLPGEPVTLLELGASAGLLLDVDRYDVRLGQVRYGDPSSAVHCVGELRGDRPVVTALPPVSGRHGLDLHPIDLDDQAQVRWLEACLWPDVPGRVERFRAAIAQVRADRPHLHRGSMVDDLSATVESIEQVEATNSIEPFGHLVVFCSWALTYVERSERERVADQLADIAGRRPVTWLTAEPPSAVPGLDNPPSLRPGDSGTVLGIQRWRDGDLVERRPIGHSHAHGEWVELTAT